MKKYSLLNSLLLVLVIAIFSSCSNKKVYDSIDGIVDEVAPGLNSIKVETLKDKIDKGDMILLVDVRESNEFNAGYIPGAVNIPRGVLEFKIDNEAFWEAAMLYMPLKDEEIILYCKKGKRSILAADALQKLGYTNVTYLEGGWKNWELTYPLMYEKNLDHNAHEDAGEVGGC